MERCGNEYVLAPLFIGHGKSYYNISITTTIEIEIKIGISTRIASIINITIPILIDSNCKSSVIDLIYLVDGLSIHSHESLIGFNHAHQFNQSVSRFRGIRRGVTIYDGINEDNWVDFAILDGALIVFGDSCLCN